jgi:hypothetical protein
MHKIYIVIFLSLFSFETFASQKKCGFKITDHNITGSDLTKKYKCKEGDRIVAMKQSNNLFEIKLQLNRFIFHNCDFGKQILISTFDDGYGQVTCVLKFLEIRE